MQYVVRITQPEREDDYKVFQSLPDARERFRLAEQLVPDILAAVYLYETPGTVDPRAAKATIQAGQATPLDRDAYAGEVCGRLTSEQKLKILGL